MTMMVKRDCLAPAEFAMPRRGFGSTGGISVPSGPARVGASLRAAREGLGSSVADIAATSRIREPYLHALETGDLSVLPGPAYAIGFVRAYADALGMDPDATVARFRRESAGVDLPVDLDFPAAAPDRHVPNGALVLMGAVLAMASYGVWLGSGAEGAGPARVASLGELPVPSAATDISPQIASVLPAGGEKLFRDVPAAPVPPPVPTAAAAPVAADAPTSIPMPAPVSASAQPAMDPKVTLRAKSDSWIQVRDRQGGVMFSRVMHSGESWAVPPGAGALTTGNAGGTELVVNGVVTPIPGNAGAVRRLPLDQASILALVDPPPQNSTPR